MAQKNEFERFFIWTQAEERPTGTTCLISSHGGTVEAKINGMAEVNAGIRLYFYVPHGQPLRQQHFDQALQLRQRSTEDSPARQSQDYRLAKVQINDVKNPKDAAKAIEENRQPELYSQLAALNYDDEEPPGVMADCDIITIRRRRLKSWPLPSQILIDAWAGGYRYTSVYCLFCRG